MLEPVIAAVVLMLYFTAVYKALGALAAAIRWWQRRERQRRHREGR